MIPSTGGIRSLQLEPWMAHRFEVSRKGGDWQRNLIASIDPAGSVWEVEVKITDDEQLAIVRVGDAEVASANSTTLRSPWPARVWPV